MTVSTHRCFAVLQPHSEVQVLSLPIFGRPQVRAHLNCSQPSTVVVVVVDVVVAVVVESVVSVVVDVSVDVLVVVVV